MIKVAGTFRNVALLHSFWLHGQQPSGNCQPGPLFSLDMCCHVQSCCLPAQQGFCYCSASRPTQQRLLLHLLRTLLRFLQADHAFQPNYYSPHCSDGKQDISIVAVLRVSFGSMHRVAGNVLSVCSSIKLLCWHGAAKCSIAERVRAVAPEASSSRQFQQAMWEAVHGAYGV